MRCTKTFQRIGRGDIAIPRISLKSIAVSCRALTSTSSRRDVNNKAGLINDLKDISQSRSSTRRGAIHGITVAKDDTIFALSTAPGKAAIAIVRCSGPACRKIYQKLCPDKPFPRPRQAALRKLYSPRDGSVLDPGALLLSFPEAATVTGEEVLELHLHGGNATVRAVLSAISSVSTPMRRIRYAEPGEFTRRAFYNDRISLTEIEALGDNLTAETEQQRRLAVRGSTGILAERYESWRQQLLHARGELEALIDFSEDQHFDESPAELAASVAQKVDILLKQVEASLQNAAKGELLRHGIKIALVGAPNVGKSSLLNLIAGREAAIVSSEAGTTRDIVETNVDIGGFFCNLGDLAGLRAGFEAEKSDAAASENFVGLVEQEGIRRAKARALEADVVLVVRSCERDQQGELSMDYPDEVAETVRKCDATRQRIIHVVNKVDYVSRHHREETILHKLQAENPVLVSCKLKLNADKSGLNDLTKRLTDTFEDMTQAIGIPGISLAEGESEVSLGATERQMRLLERCREELYTFVAM